MKRVLVTGGAGFIGSHVAEAYLARGDQVWVLDNFSTGKRENVPSGATLVEMGIESPEVEALFAKVGFDLVNHHAAQIDVRVSVSDPMRDARTNVLGLLNLLEAARKHGVRRIVYVSSGGVVYGEPEQIPTPETWPKQPLSPYGVTKLTGEYYLYYYNRVHGLEYVALRYSNVYGPRQDPHGEAGVVAVFSTRLLSGQDLHIFGDGEQTRDYVFVEDLTRANLLVSDMPLPDGDGLDRLAFNAGTEVGTSVNRLADLLQAASTLHSGREFKPARKGELRYSTLATAKLRGMGWSPRVTLEEGLAKTFRWIEEREKAGGAKPERARESRS